jgi:hypothetical protein
MQASGEFVGERLVDHPVGFDAAFSSEGLGRDSDPEMGLAAGPVADVAGVQMRLVDHLERGRAKSIG